MTLDRRYRTVLKDLEDERRLVTKGSYWHDVLTRKLLDLLRAMAVKLEARKSTGAD